MTAKQAADAAWHPVAERRFWAGSGAARCADRRLALRRSEGREGALTSCIWRSSERPLPRQARWSYGSGMPLTSSITDYDDKWPCLYEAEVKRLRPIFGDACVEFHHVGSTAVEGLAAKPEIDILVVVSNSNGIDAWRADLNGLGYRRGGDLMEGHHFFKRDVGGIRTHKLHVCASDHSQIGRMLGIRDHLRSNSADRRAYAELKFRLERENRTGIAEYLTDKAPFLDGLYRKSQTKA